MEQTDGILRAGDLLLGIPVHIRKNQAQVSIVKSGKTEELTTESQRDILQNSGVTGGPEALMSTAQNNLNQLQTS
ncbi:unnamed protein product [Schistosoma curassoni]|uniref:Uncharacterized protein n=1 Tax=Schistosoma curassoni TaxID=6186 RepID=A0A183K405_9TREM|nr:unnamed protein product [Schistosoma curassoni]